MTTTYQVRKNRSEIVGRFASVADAEHAATCAARNQPGTHFHVEQVSQYGTFILGGEFYNDSHLLAR